MWEPYKKGYKAYLQLEKSLSENSVDAYIHDIEKFTQFLSVIQFEKSPKEIELSDLDNF
ncbi:MAG: site-specific integrase, partial [Ginsengibacter sp.]